MPYPVQPSRPKGGLTHHARRRATQRRIPLLTIELIRRHGRAVLERDCFLLATDGVERPASVAPRDWSSTRGIVVVEDRDRSIVTVFRRGAVT